MEQEPWWQGASVYQIYPRSFQDSDGDGVGDLAGVTSRLTYVAELGVDAVWLSPFFAGPQRDFGYDIADYCAVDPLFGTLDDWDDLVAEARRLGLKVIIDGVLNHTSDEHPWFVESSTSRDNPRADWYIWAYGRGRRPPNNWRETTQVRSAWHFSEGRGQWYLGTFHRCQPDLNWRNPEVRTAMFDVVRFWLDRGADGIRLDMFSAIMKDPLLRSESLRPVAGGSGVRLTDGARTSNTPENYTLAEELRAVCTERRGDDGVMLIGECLGPLDEVAAYSVGRRGLTHTFLFDFLLFRFSARWFRARIRRYEAAFPPPTEPAYVLENHDRSRLLDRVGGDERKGRVLAVLLCTLRGQPTIYQGQELGMTNTYIPLASAQDPIAANFAWMPEWLNRLIPERVNRDEVRTPMQWDGGGEAGFTSSGTVPWLPLNPNWQERNVEVEAGDPSSLLVLYRRLLHLRGDHAALRTGDLELIEGVGRDVVGFTRGGGAVVVLANLGSREVRVARQVDSVLVATDGDIAVEGGTIVLPGVSAVVCVSPPGTGPALTGQKTV